MSNVTIKINLKTPNLEKIQKALDEAQGKATVRMYTDADHLMKAINDRVVDDCPVKTKKGRKGIRFAYDRWGEVFPNAYKYTPMSTRLFGHFTATGVEVTISRGVAAHDDDVKYAGLNTDQIQTALKSLGITDLYNYGRREDGQ